MGSLTSIAVLGPKGTFSDKAYLEYAKQVDNLEPVYYPTIDEVLLSVENESCALGIVPVENTLDGFVMRTLDLLLEKDLHVVAENTVSVQFSCVCSATSLDEVERLYVQFKAHAQCYDFINGLNNVKIVTTESNMESYYNLDKDDKAAAIVPKHVADAEKNRLVISDVTDSAYNHTRFVVVKKGKASEPELSSVTTLRLPVYIIPSTDRPGILFDILKNFNEHNINLMTIMSRPTKQELGTYNFYIEIDAKSDRLPVVYEALENIKKSNDIKLVGIYQECAIHAHS